MIGTLRHECLDYLIVINERHLRRVLGEYIPHYNAMRPLALDAPEERCTSRVLGRVSVRC